MNTKKSLAEILAEKKAKALEALEAAAYKELPLSQEVKEAFPEKKETFSLAISLNKEQLLAKELAFAGKTF